MRIFVYECVCAGGLGPDIPSSLLREGHAMLAAIVADLQGIPGVTVVTLIDQNLSYEIGDECRRATYPDPDFEDLDFEEFAAECDGTLVIAPEFNGLLLNRSRAAVGVGGRLLSCEPNAIQLTADKLALAEFWRLRQVPHPWTDAFNHADLSAMDPPFVLKPRHGAGSQAIYLIHDAKGAAEIAAADTEALPEGDFIVQRHVLGHAASVTLLIGKTQRVALMPARQHLSNDGRFRYLGGSLPLPEALAQRAAKLALHAVKGIKGLCGFVGVDLVLGDDGTDYAIEINPRLTTSYLGLRQLCEQNLAELMLRIVVGERIEMPTWKKSEVHFRA